MQEELQKCLWALKGTVEDDVKQNDMEVTHVPKVILACCILHNICEVHSDTFVSTWLDKTSDNQTATVPYPSTSRNSIVPKLLQSVTFFFNT